MKRLLLILLLIQSVYANQFNDAFDSAFSFLTPDVTNYLIAFFLVYGASLLGLQKSGLFGEDAKQVSSIGNIFAGALGFAAAFSVYYAQFNLISFLAPWIIFILIGVLSLLVWNIYKQFQDSGASWVTSMIASIGLITFANAINRFYNDFTFNTVINNGGVWDTLYAVSPFLMILGIITLFYSLFRAYRALIPKKNDDDDDNTLPRRNDDDEDRRPPVNIPRENEGGGGGISVPSGGSGPTMINNNIDVNILAGQLLASLGVVVPIYQSTNIQNLINILQQQNFINQLNVNNNSQVALQLIQIINQNPNNPQIIQIVNQLLILLGRNPVPENNPNLTYIVGPGKVSIYRGLEYRKLLKFNVQIPTGQKSYTLHFKHDRDMILFFRNQSLPPEYTITINQSTTFDVEVIATDKVVPGINEIVIELLDGSKVLDVARVELNVVEKSSSSPRRDDRDDRDDDSLPRRNDDDKLPPPPPPLNKDKFYLIDLKAAINTGLMTRPLINMLTSNNMILRNLKGTNRFFELFKRRFKFKLITPAPGSSLKQEDIDKSGRFMPDMPGYYRIGLTKPDGSRFFYKDDDGKSKEIVIQFLALSKTQLIANKNEHNEIIINTIFGNKNRSIKESINKAGYFRRIYPSSFSIRTHDKLFNKKLKLKGSDTIELYRRPENSKLTYRSIDKNGVFMADVPGTYVFILVNKQGSAVITTKGNDKGAPLLIKVEVVDTNKIYNPNKPEGNEEDENQGGNEKEEENENIPKEITISVKKVGIPVSLLAVAVNKYKYDVDNGTTFLIREKPVNSKLDDKAVGKFGFAMDGSIIPDVSGQYVIDIVNNRVDKKVSMTIILNVDYGSKQKNKYQQELITDLKQLLIEWSDEEKAMSNYDDNISKEDWEKRQEAFKTNDKSRFNKLVRISKSGNVKPLKNLSGITKDKFSTPISFVRAYVNEIEKYGKSQYTEKKIIDELENFLNANSKLLDVLNLFQFKWKKDHPDDSKKGQRLNDDYLREKIENIRKLTDKIENEIRRGFSDIDKAAIREEDAVVVGGEEE